MTIAVDFDHTLCHSVWPGTGEPNRPVIEKLKKLQAEGHHLILWTCREGDLLDQAIAWCRNYGLEFEAINDNPKWLQEKFGNNCRKIGVDYFLDDRALPIDRFLEEGFDNGLTEKVSRDPVYMVKHKFDVDGGFGDAIPQEEYILSFRDKSDAELFVKEFSQPHVYSKPYDSLWCGELVIDEINPVSYSEAKVTIEKKKRRDFVAKSEFRLLCGEILKNDKNDWPAS